MADDESKSIAEEDDDNGIVCPGHRVDATVTKNNDPSAYGRKPFGVTENQFEVDHLKTEAWQRRPPAKPC
jgi:hypothetical protein